MDADTEFKLADNAAAQVYLITKGEGSRFGAYVLGNEVPEVSQEIGMKVWQVRVFTKEPKFDGVHLSYNPPLGSSPMLLCEDGTLFSVGGPSMPQASLKEQYDAAKSANHTDY